MLRHPQNVDSRAIVHKCGSPNNEGGTSVRNHASPLFLLKTGTHGTTQPLGAAVMKREASGTFGPPAEALRNDPAKYLKRGAKTKGGGGPSEGSACNAVLGAVFIYPGER